MYDILIPVTDEILENEYIRCPEDDKDITYKEETQLIREYLTEPKDVHIKLINASSLALHYEIKIREIIKPLKDSKLRTKIIEDLLEILKIKDPSEKLCRLYFILDGDIKKILNYEEYEEEWTDYLNKFDLKIYASGPTLESTMYSKENIDITTIDIIFLYDLNKTGLEKIIFNYLEFLIAKYPDMQSFFCNNGRTMEERFGYLMLFKERLINLIGIEQLKKLEMKYPEILRIDFMEKNVTISYYEQYVQHPLDSSISIEAIKSLNTRFLLGKITYQYSLIDIIVEENNYLHNIFKERLDWAINKAYHKFNGGFYSDEKLCFMVEFIKILEKCMKIAITNPNQAALLINIWTGAFCRREQILKKALMEVQELVSSLHFNFLKDLSSQILQKCTQPGMLSKLDLLSPNVTIQEFYEVDKPQVADKNELINNLVDSFKKLNLEEGLSTENNENKIENSKSPFKIKDDKKAEILESNTKSLPEKPEMIEQKINIEKPSTTTKAKLSKKKRDQEKKKNLELKNLEEKSVEEISDNKIEEIEGEGLTSSQSKIINKNTIIKSLGEDTISEDLEDEKLEGAKIEEQKTDKKPIMKHLEDKIIKSSKGKGKANVNKNIKAKHGKKDKKEEINKIIKEDDELTRNNELTVFVENNELIDVLKEKKHWKNIRKSNFIIDRTVSLEEAIADIKKIVELWVNDNLEKINKIFFQNKNAFTLISGSYLLNINSVESDVDFIVVLPFNYTDNNGKFVTKIMLDDEFMGSKSECNFDKREECSEKGSLYCVLCESKATSWLRKITTGVSEINATIHNYSFDLAFVAYPWERNSEQILNFIKSEESLNEIDNFILNFTEQFGTNLQFDRFGMINSLSGS
uniref:Uncharacterized protein n=1 Tax=Meloidogyne enterolobii TaxID=390850 RepID=A0A6V7VAD0_MELEN|nr:unnamed protein product [Meloidogyne enterolobii]